MCKPNLSSLASKWPSAFVARSEVSRFSGGLISDRYLANLDSQGAGPPGRVKIGPKVAYPVDALVSWLEARSCNQDE
jgi:hypothetical protein